MDDNKLGTEIEEILESFAQELDDVEAGEYLGQQYHQAKQDVYDQTKSQLLTLFATQDKQSRIQLIDKCIATVKRNPEQALDLLWKQKVRLQKLKTEETS